jgi:hypothetical protein
MVAVGEHMFSAPKRKCATPAPRPEPIAQRGRVMFHSHWEMEVFAREIQDTRMREAERDRSIAAVSPVARRNTLVFAAERVAGVLRSMFTGPQKGQPEEVSRGAVGTPRLVLETVKETAPAARPRVNPLTAPYAAMVVVARGPSPTALAQSSRGGDR